MAPPGVVSLDAIASRLLFSVLVEREIHTARWCVGSQHSVKIPLAQERLRRQYLPLVFQLHCGHPRALWHTLPLLRGSEKNAETA